MAEPRSTNRSVRPLLRLLAARDVILAGCFVALTLLYFNLSHTANDQARALQSQSRVLHGVEDLNRQIATLSDPAASPDQLAEARTEARRLIEEMQAARARAAARGPRGERGPAGAPAPGPQARAPGPTTTGAPTTTTTTAVVCVGRLCLPPASLPGRGQVRRPLGAVELFDHTHHGRKP